MSLHAPRRMRPVAAEVLQVSNRVYESKKVNTGVFIAKEIAVNDIPRIIANELWDVAHRSSQGYSTTPKFRVPTGWFANVVLTSADQKPEDIVLSWDTPRQNRNTKEWSIARIVQIFSLDALACILGADNIRPQLFADNGAESGWNDGSKEGDLRGGYIHLEINRDKVFVMQHDAINDEMRVTFGFSKYRFMRNQDGSVGQRNTADRAPVYVSPTAPNRCSMPQMVSPWYFDHQKVATSAETLRRQKKPDEARAAEILFQSKDRALRTLYDKIGNLQDSRAIDAIVEKMVQALDEQQRPNNNVIVAGAEAQVVPEHIPDRNANQPRAPGFPGRESAAHRTMVSPVRANGLIVEESHRVRLPVIKFHYGGGL